LSDEQIQKMLKAEFGGMNEVLVDLYADSGDDRWLKLSQKFEDRSITEPLAQGKDILGGQHANHNIPKLVGAAARFACTGQGEDRRGAEFFWTSVVNHHSFATGGNSGGADGEHFPAADKLAAMIARAPSAQTNESCNVYNMLKLTRRLFSFDPDPRYADFLERALLNHALAQINPASGLMSYHVPVGQDVQHNYQGSDSTGINTGFTCCVGTGMENPALYGEGIYYAAGDKLWVNLYAPSTAQWKEKSAELAMESDMPEGEIAKLTLTVKEPTEFTLALRRPAWTTAAFKATINGQTLPASMTEQAAAARPESLPPSTYVEIRRTWKTGDTIELVIPKSLRLEPTPDDPSVAAILWGPLVLGEDMGPAVRRAPAASGGRAAPVVDKNPVLVVSSRTVSDWLKPIDGRPGEFRTDGVGRIAASPATPVELKFVPLYRLHDRTYSVYMNVLSPDAWSHRTGETQ